jgi:hypothetical protein
MSEIGVKEFAEQLKQQIAQGAGRSGYVLAEGLIRAVDRAMKGADPAADGYPRMLYFAGQRDQTRIVASAAEESAALAQGWTRDCRPQYAEGYPKWFSEKPTGMGGTRGFDIRHITLHNSEEEKLFRSIVEIEAWQEDEVHSLYGARGVGLDTLIEDRKQLAREVLDEDFLALATGESAEGMTR